MKRSFFLFIFVLFSATELVAQTSPTLNIQGVLRDDTDKAVSDGTYQLTFKLYDVSTGGSEVWTEDQPLTITNGVYSALLGNVTNLNGVTFSTQYYLGIAVDGGLELSPRIPLSLSPYAMAVVGSENVFPSSGTVGVGTTSPDANAKLQVEGGDLVVKNGEFHLSASNIKLDGNWVSGDGDNEGVFINANGEVGIGTSNIEEDFQVDGVTFLKGTTRFNKPPVVANGRTFDYDVWIQGGADTLGGDSRNLAILGDETTDRLYLNFAGEYKGGVEIGGKTHGLEGFTATRVATHFGSGRRRIGSHGGQGGNNNIQPGFKFVGDNDTGIFSHSDGIINFFTNGIESIYANSNGLYCGDGLSNCGVSRGFSDRRVKTNISIYDSNNALGNILKLQPKSYTYKFLDADPISYGFVAQEVELVLPQAVTNSGIDKVIADGTTVENVKELDYDVITVELVLAVKQLNAKLEALSKENKALKLQLASMKGYVESTSTSSNKPKK